MKAEPVSVRDRQRSLTRVSRSFGSRDAPGAITQADFLLGLRMRFIIRARSASASSTSR
jgi:hypothetical protein